MDGALGLSLRFITRDMLPITIAAALVKMNTSHTSVNVADKLLDICSDRYGVNLRSVASGGASDTANAARGVQSVLGVEQDDCSMHVVSLLLAYTIGMKENYRTEKVTTKDGEEVKAKVVVTPGGAFPFGAEICKKLKDFATYFGSSPLRKEEFESTKRGALLPMQGIKNPGETRVSSHITLLQTSMMNHYALTLYAMKTNDQTFLKMWEDCKGDDTWKVCVCFVFICNCITF